MSIQKAAGCNFCGNIEIQNKRILYESVTGFSDLPKKFPVRLPNKAVPVRIPCSRVKFRACKITYY